MTTSATTLATVFDGWDTYNTSLVRAVAPLTPEQLAWRPAEHLRSAGEIASHIIEGRISWFQRMGAPGSDALAARGAALGSVDTIAGDATELVRWLEDSWQMVETALKSWTVADLARTYRQPYQGKIYLVSHQWTIWRIMAHDLHHGGELAVTLGMQGIALRELGDAGGHLTQPPVVGEA